MTHADASQLKFSRWSGDLNVPDPVAISLDGKGTAYVTQTQRRKSQDLDIRNNRDWVADDVGLQTVDQKRQFYRSQLAPNADQEKNRNRVADLNEDGSHDWRDLTVISEKIHWLRDSNGDGTADVMGLFAEDFQTEVTGIAAGVLWHNDQVFATIAPDVWRLQDQTGDRTADTRDIVATGFGLHIAYGGHDMHGLTVGPDGRIYWSIGDKGISVTSREGQTFHYPNQGGVMRCNPDGSDFEVFAHGLRNVQELAFDAYGNLFGVDNDSDQPDEKERFVYIVRDMDAGWRCNYQYRGDGFNPWTEERLWVPHFDGQASYILPPIQNYIDGPAGFAFNPGTGLSSDYLDHFFVTGAPGGFQYAFKTRPVGASFAMDGEHLIGKGIPIVGINFGPDGALYGVDWGGGYPLNQTGAVWKIDVPDSDLAVVRAEVAERLGQGFTDLKQTDLESLLRHPDQRLRLGAQFELVRCGKLSILRTSLKSDSEMQRVHAIWGLGQLARQGNVEAKAALVASLTSDDQELQAQACRTLTDVSDVASEHFLPLLSHSSPRVRYMACIALSKHASSEAVPKLLEISNELEESERYLRFAVTRALAHCASSKQLVTAAKEAGTVGRLNLVVALRSRSDSQSLATFLADANEQVSTEAARAIHDDLSATSDLRLLATAIENTPFQERGFVLRALSANYRMGDAKSLQRVVNFASDASRNTSQRIDALKMVATWRTPELLDFVDGRRRVLDSNRSIDDDRLQAALSDLAADQHPGVQAGAVRAARQLNLSLSTAALLELARSQQIETTLRIEALRSLAKQSPDKFEEVVDGLLVDGSHELRMVAAELLLAADPDRAATHLIERYGDSRRLDERQHAIAQLTRIDTDAAHAQLDELLNTIVTGDLPADVMLDVLESAAARAKENPERQALLAKATGRIESKTNIEAVPLRRFSVCRDGGDAEAGKRIFEKHLGAQCVRCHKVGKTGSDVGPNLKEIAKKRDRDALLRSVIAPSKEIEPKYQTQSFLMVTGEVFQGLVTKETEKTTIIVDNQGKEIRLANDDIEIVKKNTVSIMPEMIEVLTRREIRDLVAYLSTLR
ncbi:MAG: DUF7133 domain-containing protein [Rubripirellula sp.]